MKTVLLVLTLSLLTFTFNSCETTSRELAKDPVPVLTQDEIKDLTFMREEEKLARDVYQYAYAKYGLSIFNNIASSEQSHMDRIGQLIKTYELIDPIRDDTPGIFNNEDILILYTSLTAQVDQSLTEALRVGATIEDLDMKDLDEALTRSLQSDIQRAYELLRCGSGNHLRGFVGQLEQNGGSYTPQYLSLTEYQLVIEASHEHCGR